MTPAHMTVALLLPSDILETWQVSPAWSRSQEWNLRVLHQLDLEKESIGILMLTGMMRAQGFILCMPGGSIACRILSLTYVERVWLNLRWNGFGFSSRNITNRILTSAVQNLSLSFMFLCPAIRPPPIEPDIDERRFRLSYV